jgi:hypothetical protein
VIREVAYNSLPRRERAMLHERAVEALRAREPFAERPELIAYHLDHAYELDPTDERRAATREAVLAAADTAVNRGAAARGRHLYEDAARLTDDGIERHDALVAAAEVALRGWRGDEGMRLFREAGETAEHDGDTDRAAAAYARSVEVGSRMHGIAGDPPVSELAPILKRGHELADHTTGSSSRTPSMRSPRASGFRAGSSMRSSTLGSGSTSSRAHRARTPSTWRSRTRST